MFKITDYKVDNGVELFGVLDTEDSSLEFLTADTIKDIVKRTGFQIDSSQVSTLKANYIKSSQSYDISKYHSLDNVIKLYTTKGLFVGKSRFECIKELYKIMIKEVPELKGCLTFQSRGADHEIYYTSGDFYKKAPEFIPYVESLQALMILGDWKLYRSIMGNQWDNVKFDFEKYDKYRRHCTFETVINGFYVTPLDVDTWDDLHVITTKFKDIPDKLKLQFPVRCSDNFINILESIDFKSYLLYNSSLLDSFDKDKFGGRDCIIYILDCIFNNNPCNISHLDRDKISKFYYETTKEHLNRSQFCLALHYYLVDFCYVHFRYDSYISNMDEFNRFCIINSSNESYKPKFLIDMNSFRRNLESLIMKLKEKGDVVNKDKYNSPF